LLSYREAATDSLKKKAYEIVNSNQNQVDLVIQKLENQKNLAGDYLKKLVASQNQEELNIIYSEIKKSPEFSQTDTQKIIDNHQKRVQIAINLETNSTITEIERQLATKLRTIINGDTDKNTLESLQKELKQYQNSPEKTYSQHRKIIETTLAEVSSELARREQSTQEQNKVPAPVNNQSKNPAKPNKRSTNPAVIVVGGILLLTLITFLGYRVFSLRKKRLRKRLKTQKR
jgi:hypothetical protein